jgi:hypothetical protein
VLLCSWWLAAVRSRPKKLPPRRPKLPRSKLLTLLLQTLLSLPTLPPPPLQMPQLLRLPTLPPRPLLLQPTLLPPPATPLPLLQTLPPRPSKPAWARPFEGRLGLERPPLKRRPFS